MPPLLKSLELQGYKTFASRTDFQFPADITAIVGPNGSGKSNIADALRWVLGEQSFSLLRGRKTEDMIFSGSEQRPRAGMASATITFDNSSSWLPIDYSEVAITRRAYRDGQNEYLLNGQRVRLREISELLGRSGLAERTYTIIGQGLVDAALSLKPEERRELFEEAAGIGLYRSRRDEALNRLEATRRNVERVRDVLAELEPRLHSLEKQAKRVQEYNRLQDELKLLLRDWYGFQWHRSQQELAHTVESLRGQEIKTAQVREHHDTLSAELSVYRSQIQELRARLNELHHRASELHNERETLNRELAISDERLKSLHQQRQVSSADLAQLVDDLTQRNSRLAEIETEKKKAEDELAEAQRQLQAANIVLQEVKSRRGEADRALRQQRQLQVEAETRQVQLRARRGELDHRRSQAVLSLENMEKTLANCAADAEKAARQVEETVRRRLDQEAARQEVSSQLEAGKKALEALDARRRELQEIKNQLDGKHGKLTTQMQVLEQAERSFSGVAEGAKNLLQAARQGKIDGSLRPISALLEVPPEYEAAIAASLGEFLDVLCIQADIDPEQALRLLDTQKGRAALLPMRWLAMQDRPEAPSDPGYIGIAADMVSTPVEVQLAVEALLGRVLVVRDRQTARRLVTQHHKFSQCVTLNGEVFHPNGMIFAGKETRGAALARPRQKKELQASIDAVLVEVSDNQSEVEKIQKSWLAQKDQQASLEKQFLAANRALDQINDAFQQAKLGSEQARRQMEWQSGQKRNLETQVASTESELDNTNQELEKIAGTINELRERVRLASAALASVTLDEPQAQVNHWSTVLAVTERGIQESIKRLAEHRQNIERSNRQQVALQTRVGEIEVTIREMEQKRQELFLVEAENARKIETLRQMIEPDERELEKVEKTFTELQEEESQRLQALSIAERALAQIQMDVSRQKENIDSLRRKIEDDFGLVNFEYSEEVPSQQPLPFEGMVEELPVLAELPKGLEQEISHSRGQIRRLGAINPEAQEEYNEVSERYQFNINQVADLTRADQDLRKVIAELDDLMRREFRKTFDAVAQEFKKLFTRLFGGGSAKLTLLEGDNPDETGIDIETRLPGKREQGLSLLSGGERSLTAVALVFSLLKVSPTPFCVLDEVDAMLDEANVARFRDLLRELSAETQFLVITHNRNTVQTADVIYGITMGRDSTSQMISLRLEELSEEMVQ